MRLIPLSNRRFRVTKFVMNGPGTTTAHLAIAPSSTSSSCVNVLIIKPSLALSASFPYQLGARIHRPRLQDLPRSPSASSGLPSAATTTSYPSHHLRLYPLKSSLTSHFIALHSWLQNSSGPNAFTLRLPVPSNLNIPEWHRRLQDYPDKSLCDFLAFGWPVGYTSSTPPVQSYQNHGSARSNPTVIDEFLSSECELGATCGPFVTNPLSVNCGVPRDTHLGEQFSLCLPGLDALLDIIRQKSQHWHLFKKDLSRAYCQFHIDPCNYHLLGYQHRDYLYFDIAPPFGLLSSARMCQNATSAVTFMYKNLGYSCTNYIDAFGGRETSTKWTAAFQALGDLLHCLGLSTSSDKDSLPATSIVFLGVLVDTTINSR